jgi:anti-sigma regulatory factor (Ser/Thr protein kinase)
MSNRFDLNTGAPAAARHWLDELGGLMSPDRLDDLRLVVSELVTNSVLHSGTRTRDWVDMDVVVRPGRVRVEVVDHGQGFDPEEEPASTYEAGRGLSIVEELADRWGSRHTSTTTVWAEIALPGSH